MNIPIGFYKSKILEISGNKEDLRVLFDIDKIGKYLWKTNANTGFENFPNFISIVTKFELDPRNNKYDTEWYINKELILEFCYTDPPNTKICMICKIDDPFANWKIKK